jgi:hypothetical protein
VPVKRPAAAKAATPWGACAAPRATTMRMETTGSPVRFSVSRRIPFANVPSCTAGSSGIARDAAFGGSARNASSADGAATPDSGLFQAGCGARSTSHEPNRASSAHAAASPASRTTAIDAGAFTSTSRAIRRAARRSGGR